MNQAWSADRDFVEEGIDRETFQSRVRAINRRADRQVAVLTAVFCFIGCALIVGLAYLIASI